MKSENTFVIPYDFSAHAHRALYAAMDLGRRLSADLHLVHAIQPPAYAYGGYGGPVAPLPVDMAEIRQSALASLRRVAEELAEDFPGRIETHVIEGAGIASVLLDAAEKLEADLIVMGTHGRTGLAHVFLGSVAERTLRRAPCPVLTVQARAEQSEA